MRLHFLIFAKLRETPFVALPYASKVAGFIERPSRWRPPLGSISSGQLIARLDRSWDTRHEIRAKIRRAAPLGLKARARETNQLVLEPRAASPRGAARAEERVSAGACDGRDPDRRRRHRRRSSAAARLRSRRHVPAASSWTEETSPARGPADATRRSLRRAPVDRGHRGDPSYRALRQGIREYYRRHYRPPHRPGRSRSSTPGNGWVSRSGYDPRVAVAVLHEMIALYRLNGRLLTPMLTGPSRRGRTATATTGVAVRGLESGRDVLLVADLLHRRHASWRAPLARGRGARARGGVARGDGRAARPRARGSEGPAGDHRLLRDRAPPWRGPYHRQALRGTSAGAPRAAWLAGPTAGLDVAVRPETLEP